MCTCSMLTIHLYTKVTICCLQEHWERGARAALQEQQLVATVTLVRVACLAASLVVSTFAAHLDILSTYPCFRG